MARCLELAEKGRGQVAPNPMVGAVLVHSERIIGEGWHQEYGKAHAEVNCIESVKEQGRSLISESTLYVSLEPCAHYGKTPPCVDLILKNRISKVVIGCRDPFEEVNGKGIEKLMSAGVSVELGIMEKECMDLNKRFFTFHTRHRPYIILKWAQTFDGKISSGDGTRLMISNDYSNRIVHQWRSEESSILIGTNTAIEDDPELTTRLWTGKSPTRLVIDLELRLPHSLKIFNKAAPTIVFNTKKHEIDGNLFFYQVANDAALVDQVVNALNQLKIQSVLIEGGARLLQSFIDSGYWDEARIITNEKSSNGRGLSAPVLLEAYKESELRMDTDVISYYCPHENNRGLL